MSADAKYVVVVNAEEQYSVWRCESPLPAGWREIGVRGTKDECLDRIVELWHDIRPKSVREKGA